MRLEFNKLSKKQSIMKVLHVISVFLMMLLLSKASRSQGINKQKIDSFFNILERNNKAMGTIAVSRNGEIIYSRSIGYSFITSQEQIKANKDSKYRVGSITKMFTATMVLQLIEEGKIKLNTTLNHFFHHIPNADKITIENLLNHRSGLHDIINDDSIKYSSFMDDFKTSEQVIDLIAKFQPDFEPNEKSAYSNSNYIILGSIIEKITQKSYSENLKQRITDRIGLSNTYNQEGSINPQNQEAFSYQYINGWKPITENNSSSHFGCGSILSTSKDLVKYIEALFSDKLINRHSLEIMKTRKEGYGMGMNQFPYDGKIAFGHDGHIFGFTSMLFYFPEDNLTLAYITNGESYPFNKIFKGVLDIIYKKPFSIPVFKATSLNNADIGTYIGRYYSNQIPNKPMHLDIIQDNSTIVMRFMDRREVTELEATAKDKFICERNGIIIQFNTQNDDLYFSQNGQIVLFKKAKN